MNEWIKTTDRLPEHMDKVLVVFEGSDNILMASFQKRLDTEAQFYPFFADGRKATEREVTHWQPLPSPPKQWHLMKTNTQIIRPDLSASEAKKLVMLIKKGSLRSGMIVMFSLAGMLRYVRYDRPKYSWKLKKDLSNPKEMKVWTQNAQNGI